MEFNVTIRGHSLTQSDLSYISVSQQCLADQPCEPTQPSEIESMNVISGKMYNKSEFQLLVLRSIVRFVLSISFGGRDPFVRFYLWGNNVILFWENSLMIFNWGFSVPGSFGKDHRSSSRA